ncbi:MAG: sigma 54-interacting transcriptional regulator [Planctomycetota bacterium]
MKVSGTSRSGEGVPVGAGVLWRSFQERLERAARSEAALLLAGEHGVGKTWLARRCHALSSRARGPLVELNLAQGSEALIESLLFGHEQGAFTGAHRARQGAVRRAEGGTLVLTGVQEIPLGLQVKLLRLLQEKVVEPLGSETNLPVDVRVICTAGTDLQEQVAQGRFRETCTTAWPWLLEVPALRTRFEGAADWLPSLVRQAAARVARPERELSPEALERLAGIPGRVTCASSKTPSNGPWCWARRLPGRSGRRNSSSLARPSMGRGHLAGLAREALAQGVSYDAWEGALLDQALQQHHGRVSAAARAVGLSRKAFEYRLARWQQRKDGAGGEERTRDERVARLGARVSASGLFAGCYG